MAIQLPQRPRIPLTFYNPGKAASDGFDEGWERTKNEIYENDAPGLFSRALDPYYGQAGGQMSLSAPAPRESASDRPTQRVAQAHGDGDLRTGILQTAAALGINPLDLATAISYETGGTFDPTQAGPTTQWGQHRGLIQFGEPQAKQYGVDWANPVASQLGPKGAVANYLRDTGVQPGMGLLDIYSAINAGGVGRYDASDANNGGAPGTVRDKVEKQMAAHRQKAAALLRGESGGSGAQAGLEDLTAGDGYLAAGQQSGGIPDRDTMRELFANPQTRPLAIELAKSLISLKEDGNDPLKKLQVEKAMIEIDALRNPRIAPTDDMREYEFARQQGYRGSFQQFMTDMKRAGASNTSVTVGGEPSDGELRKGLDKAEAELWGEYKKQGAVSGGMGQDFEVLDELMKSAPQGMLQGRLAEMFPGFSSAGDAFQSIVKRIAPTLRAPGSGATSDIEYDGMLKSLPALRNKPEANVMIGEIMKAKAALNMQRSDIVTRYQTGEISASDARRMIGEIDKRSIMTPEMKRALAGIGPADTTAPVAGDVVDGYRFNGGNPAVQSNWEKAD